MWSADLAEVCPGSLVIGGVINGYAHYQATSEIRSTNTINYGPDNELHLTAGDAVTLKPGFVARRHNLFTAQIGGCPSGGVPGG